MQQLVEHLAPGMGMGSHVVVAKEAARLGRADLGSAVVTELTSLAGTMGRIYAQHGGEARITAANGEWYVWQKYVAQHTVLVGVKPSRHGRFWIRLMKRSYCSGHTQ